MVYDLTVEEIEGFIQRGVHVEVSCTVFQQEDRMRFVSAALVWWSRKGGNCPGRVITFFPIQCATPEERDELARTAGDLISFR